MKVAMSVLHGCGFAISVLNGNYPAAIWVVASYLWCMQALKG